MSHNSVLLIDEPELHLNPRLITGLASFYHRHLGRALNNQLWLVTHSDTLIREAVGQVGFTVFHMQPPGQYHGSNQVTAVIVAQDVERLVIELVGDLAAYRPGAKIVIFEGLDSEFDAKMTCTLFPRLERVANTVSAVSGSQATAARGRTLHSGPQHGPEAQGAFHPPPALETTVEKATRIAATKAEAG
jgi:hypothetical protein